MTDSGGDSALSRGNVYLGRVALALEGSTEIVDDNGSTARAEEEAVGLTKTTTGAGDHDDLAVKPQLLSHVECGWDMCMWGKMVLETNNKQQRKGRFAQHVGV